MGKGRVCAWKVCNLIMALFFALAAYVQVNDPDAGMWIVLYSVPSLLTLLVGLHPDITGNFLWKILSDLHVLACCLGATCLGWFLVSHKKGHVIQEEEGRELSGLVIIILWMILCRSSEKSAIDGVRLAIALCISALPFMIWLYIYLNTEMRALWPEHCKTVI
uniref:Transmembrane protein 220 isoform X1 n=2 Tax=Geotrypetes seraphini TaxID=260995 RepID=A0A6P8SI18_GEOSA|nr:transmembrane protein 220 isoform X1 [Geotrypetes seraphini]